VSEQIGSDFSDGSQGEGLPSVEVREALDGLRREIRSRFSSTSSHAVDPINWMTLLETVQRRVSALGMSERSGEVDEFGVDELVLRRAGPILDLLFDNYWRVDFHHAERIPSQEPCLLVANRSGLLPYDGLMISHAVSRIGPRQRPRFLVADWLMTLPFVQPYLARLGGVRACPENAERLLDSGKHVVVFPEGQKGAAKNFRDRYRLSRFGRGGVVRLAIGKGVPIVPVGVVGAEEVHPLLLKWGLPARMLGLPFLPVTPTFPLLGPLGLLPLPTKWVIRVGEPIRMDHLGPDAASDELLVARVTEDLRGRIGELVDLGLGDRQSVWE
jgi:1-acyl-sn-glycerol-3-phosphate acyltransferase